MTNYKITYFDIDGGRPEPIRIALHAAGIEFEDERISYGKFLSMRESTRFHTLPVFELNNAQVTQTNAFSRYVGKLTGLYPKDDFQALYCDEAMDAVEGLLHYLGPTMGLKGKALEEARKEFVDRRLIVHLRGLAQLLARGGGHYFADNQLTMADIKVYVTLKTFASGKIEYVPSDIIKTAAPSLLGYLEQMASEKCITDYYAKSDT